MTISSNPTTARDGLIVDLDPANISSFNSSENLILYSQDFDNGAWFKDNCTATANSTRAPDGTVTADTLVSTLTGGNNNVFVNEAFSSLPTNTPYTYSIYVKKGTSPTTLIDFYVSSPYTEVNALITWPTTGSATPSIVYGFGGAATAATLLSSSFTAVNEEWWRVTMTMSTGSGTALNCRVYIRGQGTNNVSGETVYVWGAQLEKSGTASRYITTAGSAITRGTTFNNLISTSYPGTINGAVYYHNDNAGSFTFNDTTGNYISLYTIPDSFWNAGSWSVSAWVKINSTSKVSGDNAVLSHGIAGNSQGLHLGIRNNVIYFGFYSNDIGSSSLVVANRWYHITWVFDYGQKQRLVYVNGAIDYTGAITGSVGYSGTGTNTELGRYPWSAGQMLSGYLGRVQIYNRVLTTGEVSQNFAGLAGRYGYGL